MKILIPNATGPLNIGDQAILGGLISLLDFSYKNYELTIHSSSPELYDKSFKYRVKPHIYFWSVYKNRNFFVRIFRVIQVIIQYLLLSFGIKAEVGEKDFVDILKDFFNADLIILAGGGYLRSKKGLKQSLNLIMMLTMLQIAKKLNGNIICGSMSVGPFAYQWQQRLTANCLKDVDLISLREEFSYKILEDMKLNNIIISNDQAFLLNSKTKDHSSKKTVGFTIREWFQDSRQIILEESYAEALSEMVKKYNYAVQPIIQVRGRTFGEDDHPPTSRILKNLHGKELDILPIFVIHNYQEALDIYSSIDILLGMRMHSNILASISNTPFVAISYEYKTDGIVHILGLDDYLLDSSRVKPGILKAVLRKAIANEGTIRSLLKEKIHEIRNREFKMWKHILQSYQV